MENDIIITLGVFFFCGALLTFWIKKRWKKAPPEDELKAKFRDGPVSEDEEEENGPQNRSLLKRSGSQSQRRR